MIDDNIGLILSLFLKHLLRFCNLSPGNTAVHVIVEQPTRNQRRISIDRVLFLVFLVHIVLLCENNRQFNTVIYPVCLNVCSYLVS